MISRFPIAPSYPPSFPSSPISYSLPLSAPAPPQRSMSPIRSEVAQLEQRAKELERDLKMSREETDDAICELKAARRNLESSEQQKEGVELALAEKAEECEELRRILYITPMVQEANEAHDKRSKLEDPSPSAETPRSKSPDFQLVTEDPKSSSRQEEAEEEEEVIVDKPNESMVEVVVGSPSSEFVVI